MEQGPGLELTLVLQTDEEAPVSVLKTEKEAAAPELNSEK